MFLRNSTDRAFTLIELLVSISIIGILSTVVYASFSTSQAQSRDQARQTTLKEAQLALERYYNQNGHYPEPGSGCGTPSKSVDCPTTYIQDVVPDYMDELPGDDTFEYEYHVDTTPEPAAFKLVALGVEELTVNGYEHPFAYCPRKVNNSNYTCNAGGPPEEVYAVYSRNGWDI